MLEKRWEPCTHSPRRKASAASKYPTQKSPPTSNVSSKHNRRNETRKKTHLFCDVYGSTNCHSLPRVPHLHHCWACLMCLPCVAVAAAPTPLTLFGKKNSDARKHPSSSFEGRFVFCLGSLEVQSTATRRSLRRCGREVFDNCP